MYENLAQLYISLNLNLLLDTDSDVFVSGNDIAYDETYFCKMLQKENKIEKFLIENLKPAK